MTVKEWKIISKNYETISNALTYMPLEYQKENKEKEQKK